MTDRRSGKVRAKSKSVMILVPLVLAAVACGSPDNDPPHIFLVVVDTLRADSLGCYGYGVRTTPNIDRFARSAAVYENARAQSSWTKTSVASLFTGVYPHRHGVFEESGPASILPAAVTTLAEALQQHGYRTVALSANPHITAPFGFAQGFDVFEQVGTWAPNTTDALTEAVFAALETLEGHERLFHYIHYLDPHDPWELSPVCEPFVKGMAIENQPVKWGAAWYLSGEAEIRDQLEAGRLPERHDLTDDELIYLKALYDCEVWRVDAAIGRILDYLREGGWLENSVVVITSDHGEEFLEHEMLLHGYQLYDETVRIPLILSVPGRTDPGWRNQADVELFDLFPTLLSLAGVRESISQGDGEVLPGLGGATPPADSVAPSLGITKYRKRNLAYLVSGNLKLIHDLANDDGRLFDLRSDPGEQSPLLPLSTEEGRRLTRELRRRIAASEANAYPRDGQADAEIDETLRERLRSLGYAE